MAGMLRPALPHCVARAGWADSEVSRSPELTILQAVFLHDTPRNLAIQPIPHPKKLY